MKKANFVIVFTILTLVLVFNKAAKAGVLIKECSDKAQVTGIVQEALSVGMNCLRNLNTPITLDHLSRLNRKINDPQNPYTITCYNHELTSDGVRIGGMADVNGNSMRIDQENLEASAVFHELFHSIGYEHQSGVEYAYACQACCMVNDDSSLKAIACKICSDKYNRPNQNIGYLSDMNQFMKAVAHTRTMKIPRAAEALSPLPQWIRLLAFNPKNKLVLKELILNLATDDDNRSTEVANELLTQVLKNDSSIEFTELKSLVKPAFGESMAHLPWYKDFKSKTNTLANLLYACYNGDKAAARSSFARSKEINMEILSSVAIRSMEACTTSSSTSSSARRAQDTCSKWFPQALCNRIKTP